MSEDYVGSEAWANIDGCGAESEYRKHFPQTDQSATVRDAQKVTNVLRDTEALPPQ